MITGVETAGLVLAVLPLLIAAAKQYREGLVIARGWLKYREILKDLIHVLSVEREKFQLTCEKLLIEIIPEGKMHLLIESAGTDRGWDNEELKCKLKQRLRDSLPVFLDTVSDMRKSLDSLRVMLQLDERGNVCPP
jgi:hypothetical protein